MSRLILKTASFSLNKNIVTVNKNYMWSKKLLKILLSCFMLMQMLCVSLDLLLEHDFACNMTHEYATLKNSRGTYATLYRFHSTSRNVF